LEDVKKGGILIPDKVLNRQFEEHLIDCSIQELVKIYFVELAYVEKVLRN
jgi:hypothetical protein